MTARGTSPVWTPEALLRLRELVAERLTDEQIGLELGKSRSAIEAARRKYNIPSKARGSGETAPVHDDFPRLGPTLTIRAAARHFGAGRDTIRRWHRELGTSPLEYFKVRDRAAPRVAAPQRIYQRGFSTMQAMRAPERASTLAACAQRHLQRFFPVYRANVEYHNAPDDAWIVAGRRISEAEMIQVARRKGFEVAA